MNERKEFIGIEYNECFFQGKVIEDPIIQNEMAFMKVRCTTNELQANGQWANTPIVVPMMATNANVVNTINRFVKAGRKLRATCHYKPWTDESGASQHVFMVRNLILGSKPFEESNKGSNIPFPN